MENSDESSQTNKAILFFLIAAVCILSYVYISDKEGERAITQNEYYSEWRKDHQLDELFTNNHALLIFGIGGSAIIAFLIAVSRKDP